MSNHRFSGSGTSVDIPELGEMMIMADLDWTMEAVMNLMKNCMEHSTRGCVHCSYAQNPLYTEILLRDEGEGFAKEDIPRLFERFYREKMPVRAAIGLAWQRRLLSGRTGRYGQGTGRMGRLFGDSGLWPLKQY